MSTLDCPYIVLHLAQECQAAVTLLLSEACLFVTRTEDSFDFHVAKRLASHLFGFGIR